VVASLYEHQAGGADPGYSWQLILELIKDELFVRLFAEMIPEIWGEACFTLSKQNNKAWPCSRRSHSADC
jgi:hypothetical protein